MGWTTETWIMVGAGLVFFAGVFVYLLFMIFLPEWVGITGKVALEAEKSHQGGTPAGPEAISKLQREHRAPDEVPSTAPSAASSDQTKKS